MADFNPRPLAGATYEHKIHSASEPYFNPRPLAGATVGLKSPRVVVSHFNPRPLAGATKTAIKISFLC